MKFYDFRNSTGGAFCFWRIVVAVDGEADRPGQLQLLQRTAWRDT
jgi:hypothetical protein